MNKSVFLDELDQADIKPIYKSNQEIKKKIIDLYVSYIIYQKSLNVAFMINLVTLISYYQNIIADLEKGLAHNTAF